MSAAEGRPQSRSRKRANGGQRRADTSDGQGAAAAGTPTAVAATSAYDVPPAKLAARGLLAAATSTTAATGAVPSSSSTAEAAPQQAQISTGVQPLTEQTRKKLRRSPRLNSQIDLLAQVELQLVMQLLDTESKLKATRCSQWLLQAADHPFAWSGAKDFTIDSRFKSQPGTLVSRSPLRHVPIALVVASDLIASQVALIPRVRELFVWNREEDSFRSLLSLPALRGLQALRLHCSPSESIFRQLPNLPRCKRCRSMHGTNIATGAGYSPCPRSPSCT